MVIALFTRVNVLCNVNGNLSYQYLAGDCFANYFSAVIQIVSKFLLVFLYFLVKPSINQISPDKTVLNVKVTGSGSLNQWSARHTFFKVT